MIALEPDEQSIADLIALLEEGTTPEEIRQALALAKGFDEEELADVETLRSRIRERLDAREDRQRSLARTTETALGELVEHFGGHIDEQGAITLPDELLFEQGDAIITGRLDEFLQEACQPWFEALQSLPFDIHEIRVEGHASSEWGSGTTDETAYFNNLSLSQQRASAVLRACLRHTGANEIGTWARSRTVAVGHSSSRPIRDASGEEDPARSRRVVFAATTRPGDILDEIDAAITD